MRLLTGSALRYLEQKKPHLAAEKLKAMAALPQTRQGGRPAFMAALGYVIAVERGDVRAMDELRVEASRLLGSDKAAGMRPTAMVKSRARGSPGKCWINASRASLRFEAESAWARSTSAWCPAASRSSFFR